MKHLLLLLSITCSATYAQEKNVLFVGNSLTYYHDMPQTLQKMLDEGGMNIKIDQRTVGGFRLVDHATFIEDANGNQIESGSGKLPVTVAKILSKKWDIVVLQERSTTVLNPFELEENLKPSIHFMDSLVKSNSGVLVLFQGFTLNSDFPVSFCVSKNISFGMNGVKIDTNAFKSVHGSAEIEHFLNGSVVCSDSFHNSAEEFLEIKSGYDQLAKSVGGFVAPVGYAFELCKIKYPMLQLYEEAKDGHPSKQGSYLIACVFFKFFTGKNLTDIKYCADVNDSEAKMIRDLVSDVPMQ